MQTPIFSNMTTSTVYSTFNRGLRLGNNPQIFMKVGDSVSATQPFLYGFGEANYNLGPYANLQATIDFFSVSPLREVANSFVRNSVTAVNGFVSGAVFDGTWSPEYCNGLVPLECEYDIMHPSVAIVLLARIGLFDASFFETNMRRVTVDLKALGVIPVFSTFPMHASYRLEQTIRYTTTSSSTLPTSKASPSSTCTAPCKTCRTAARSPMMWCISHRAQIISTLTVPRPSTASH